MGISIQVSSRVLNAQMMKELFWHTVATEDTRKLQLIYIYMYIWDIQGPLFTNHLHKFCPIWFIHSSALRKSKMAGWEIHHECRCKIFPMGKKEDFQPIILVYQKVSSSRFCC